MVASNLEAGRRILAEEGDARVVRPVTDAQRTARAGGVGRIAERRIGAEGDIRQIQGIAAPNPETAPVKTDG